MITVTTSTSERTFESVREYAIYTAVQCIMEDMPHWMYVSYLDQYKVEGSVFCEDSYKRIEQDMINGKLNKYMEQ